MKVSIEISKDLIPVMDVVSKLHGGEKTYKDVCQDAIEWYLDVFRSYYSRIEKERNEHEHQGGYPEEGRGADGADGDEAVEERP